MYDESDTGCWGEGGGHWPSRLGHHITALLRTPHHRYCLTPMSHGPHCILSLSISCHLGSASLGGVQDERMSLEAKQAFGCICAVGLRLSTNQERARVPSSNDSFFVCFVCHLDVGFSQKMSSDYSFKHSFFIIAKNEVGLI